MFTAVLVSIDHSQAAVPIVDYDGGGHVDYPETIVHKDVTYRFVVRTYSDFYYFEDATGLKESHDYLKSKVR